MHIWLFLIATFHIAVTITQLAIAAARISLWRRWERAELARERRVSSERPTLAPAPTMLQRLRSGVTFNNGAGSSGGGDSGNAAVGVDAGALARALGAAEPDQEAPAVGSGSNGSHAAALQGTATRLRWLWRFRLPGLSSGSWAAWLLELVVCCLQALWPNIGARACAGCGVWGLRCAHELPARPEPSLTSLQPRPCATPAVTRSRFLVMRRTWLDSERQASFQARHVSGGGSGGEPWSSGPAAGADGCMPGGADGEEGGDSKKEAERAPPSFVDHVLECLESDLPSLGAPPGPGRSVRHAALASRALGMGQHYVGWAIGQGQLRMCAATHRPCQPSMHPPTCPPAARSRTERGDGGVSHRHGAAGRRLE